MTARTKHVRISNEYLARFPVWAVWDDGDLRIEDQNIFSAGLQSRLIDWAANFNDHYDFELGWSSLEQLEAHVSTGLALFQAVREELAPDVPVKGVIWEVSICGRPAGEARELTL